MKYVMRISDGVMFPVEGHEHLVAKGGHKLVDANGKSEEDAAVEEVGSEPGVDADRQAQIIDAIQQLDPATFKPATKSNPAVPKIASVAGLLGYAVTAEEILAAVKAMTGDVE